jgi:hypothetical protein
MIMKYLILLITFGIVSAHSQQIVNDPTVVATIVEHMKQGAQQLDHLKQQLQTAKGLYDTAQSALKYQGNPAAVIGGIKDTFLGGSLNPSNIGSTFDRLLGSLGSASNISSQLQGLLGGQSITVDSIKNQLLAGQSPATNLAKYQAIETLFDQQQQQLKTASAQSANLRSELASLRDQVKNSQDQATTEKLLAAIESTSATLASTDATISQLQQQTLMSAQMVQNRKLMEDAAYQEAYKQISDQQSAERHQKMEDAVTNLNKNR